MKLEIIKCSENETVETYLLADISMFYLPGLEESSHIIALNELSQIMTNLDPVDSEMSVAPRVDFYLPDPLKDRMLSQFVELHPDMRELSDQLADGLNEGPYLKLSTVLSTVVAEISRNHQPNSDYKVKISDE